MVHYNGRELPLELPVFATIASEYLLMVNLTQTK